MKLVDFDLHRFELPFSEPLTLKGAVLHHREGLLLELAGAARVLSGGNRGRGRASSAEPRRMI